MVSSAGFVPCIKKRGCVPVQGSVQGRGEGRGETGCLGKQKIDKFGTARLRDER